VNPGPPGPLPPAGQARWLTAPARARWQPAGAPAALTPRDGGWLLSHHVRILSVFYLRFRAFWPGREARERLSCRDLRPAGQASARGGGDAPRA